MSPERAAKRAELPPEKRAERRAARRAAMPIEQRLFRQNPRPLVDPDNKIMVVWSPKSACTSTLVWFLKVIGRLEEARQRSVWPHSYRIEAYYHSDLYKRGTSVPLTDYRLVRVMRDPYARVVSSYRHALGTRYAEGLLQQYDPALDRQKGFSFQTYLDFLSSLDLQDTNPHHAIQHHPIEDVVRPIEVINISKRDLFKSLNEVEEHLGLPRTDFAAIDWIREFEDRRKAKVGGFGETADDMPLNVEAARGEAPWPDHKALLTPRARQRIEHLYAKDFEAYGAYL